MKILFVNPPWPGEGYGTRSQNRIIKKRADKFLQFPIYPAYAIAQLKKAGFEAHYLDSIIDDLNLEQTNQKIKELAPDILIIETTTPSIEYDFEFLRKIKEILPKLFIITVGPHVTYFSKEALEECKAIDVIIKGEYDSRVVKVIKNKNSPEEVKGITFRQNGEIIDNGSAVFEHDLDRLEFPDRETIPFEKYGEAWYNKKPFTNILSSRGCPYGCKFCISSHITEGKQWRTRSIPNVIAEIKELQEKYNVKEINIDDPTFTISRDRVIEFCKAIQDNNIDILWTCNARVDNVDYKMLAEMRKAGCKMIRYGIESADPEVLKSINKGITVEQMKIAFYLTKKAGILALGGFMFGFPADSKESIEKTLQLAKELKPDLIQASIAMAYPGTPLYEEAEIQGKIIAKSWNEYDMTYGPIVETKDMTREYLLGILKRVYKEFYYRPGFVWQTVTRIKRPSDISRIMRNISTLAKTTNFYGKEKEC